MKKILIILLFLMPLGLFAQTDRELLLELVKQGAETNKQIAETNKQVAELAKQGAVNTAEIKGLDKRLDILLYAIVGIGSTLFVSIMSLVGAIFWDRRAMLKPFETKVGELEKDVISLKERETKSENFIKRVVEKFPDLATS